jgi:enoyl-CoA hydratase/carnithine racemase
MLRYEVDAPRATLTIDDPQRRNPMSNEIMAAMLNRVAEASSDPRVRVIVVTGAGDRAFSAGGDLGGGFVDTPVAQHHERGSLARLLRLMRRCGRPIVGRVNGHALGGGFGLAAACDVTIAADHALLGTPEVRVGLWPAMISAVLRDVMPRKTALEMMLTGRRIDAHEAQRLGIVSRVVTADELDAAVDEVVGALASFSPAVLRMGRDAWHAIGDMDFDSALELLHLELTSAAMTEDAMEGVAAFLQKRPPEWRGR